MRRAIEAISIVCGVVAIVILAVAAMPVPFGALRRTSLMIALLAAAGLFYVSLGLVRRRGGESVAERSTSLISAGATLMALAAVYGVLINETVR
jgi:hypothetical protein